MSQENACCSSSCHQTPAPWVRRACALQWWDYSCAFEQPCCPTFWSLFSTFNVLLSDVTQKVMLKCPTDVEASERLALGCKALGDMSAEMGRLEQAHAALKLTVVKLHATDEVHTNCCGISINVPSFSFVNLPLLTTLKHGDPLPKPSFVPRLLYHATNSMV